VLLALDSGQEVKKGTKNQERGGGVKWKTGLETGTGCPCELLPVGIVTS